jgi:mono/diheme cytochrome c family protein
MKALAATAFGVVLVLSGPRSDEVPTTRHGPLSTAVARAPGRAARMSSDAATTAEADAALTAVVQRYCQVCHNDQMLTGNLSLQGFDVAAAGEMPEKAEKIVLKLRAAMMPPPGMPRPAGDTLQLLAETLENAIDRAATTKSNPGTRRFQRLNRAEYQRAIRDLLGLEVKAEDWLPIDTKSANFDNISDAQALSPTLLETYLNAAADISRLAVGDPNAATAAKAFSPPARASQHEWDHVEGTPYGTRGGLVVAHVFPADADYAFEVSAGSRGGASRFEKVDISIDGEPVATLDIENGIRVMTERIPVRAGQHRVSAAFVRNMEGPYADVFRPNGSSRNRAGGTYGGYGAGQGITEPLQLGELVIRGPFDQRGVSESPSRQRIFSCRPASASEERGCAEQILSRLAAAAYRRPVAERDVSALMTFYERGAADGGFDMGVRIGIQAILASPHFIFRLEQVPQNARPGEDYALADVDLATRLSFFLWGALPDEELLRVAREGKLSDPRVLEQQARRMLADPRADALGSRFAAQWLRLDDMAQVDPDSYWFPAFDQYLADAMRRETELFFNALVRENRSYLDFFTADFTYVNDRLARHYGIPGVTGTHFRRVQQADPTRRGILGHASVLLATSMSTRTSPVLRGKWVMEVLNGTPPPPPPPNVPPLDATAAAKSGRLLTTRERMELHRNAPMCNACHQFMDPIGLALDNFDAIGKGRIRENGAPLDTRGVFYDGTPVSSPRELTDVLLKRPIPLSRSFTRNLMAYALGRRVAYYDEPTVRAIARRAERDGYRMSSFILGVVQSDAFRTRRASETTSQEAGS